MIWSSSKFQYISLSKPLFLRNDIGEILKYNKRGLFHSCKIFFSLSLSNHNTYSTLLGSRAFNFLILLVKIQKKLRNFTASLFIMLHVHLRCVRQIRLHGN